MLKEKVKFSEKKEFLLSLWMVLSPLPLVEFNSIEPQWKKKWSVRSPSSVLDSEMKLGQWG